MNPSITKAEAVVYSSGGISHAASDPTERTLQYRDDKVKVIDKTNKVFFRYLSVIVLGCEFITGYEMVINGKPIAIQRLLDVSNKKYLAKTMWIFSEKANDVSIKIKEFDNFFIIKNRESISGSEKTRKYVVDKSDIYASAIAAPSSSFSRVFSTILKLTMIYAKNVLWKEKGVPDDVEDMPCYATLAKGSGPTRRKTCAAVVRAELGN